MKKVSEIHSVDTEEISALREVLRGQVLVAGDPEYDEARRVWNSTIDRRPGLIVRCADSTFTHPRIRRC